MTRLLNFAGKYWQYLAVVLSALFILWRVYDYGYETAVAEYEEQAFEAKAKGWQETLTVQKDIKNIKDKVDEAKQNPTCKDIFDLDIVACLK